MKSPEGTDATRLLERIERGDDEASAELLPLLYGELRRIASENMARERAAHTLQPTALVHEAWMRLLGNQVEGDSGPSFNGREHFLRTAAQVMRRVLVDHARARRADKRGGQDLGERVELDQICTRFEDQGTGLIELDDALVELAATDEQLARIVELRTFGGLTMPEVASTLGVSLATAERRAKVARLWLADALGRS